jgi:hypothetical protein
MKALLDHAFALKMIISPHEGGSKNRLKASRAEPISAKMPSVLIIFIGES